MIRIILVVMALLWCSVASAALHQKFEKTDIAVDVVDRIEQTCSQKVHRIFYAANKEEPHFNPLRTFVQSMCETVLVTDEVGQTPPASLTCDGRLLLKLHASILEGIQQGILLLQQHRSDMSGGLAEKVQADVYDTLLPALEILTAKCVQQ